MIIQHIKTPETLHLMWKDDESHRHRVGELTENSFRYLFDDEEFEEAKALNFKGYPAFSLKDKKYKNPVPAFMRRCPPRSRTGFSDYLKNFGLDPAQKEVKKMSDFQLLAYTGAVITGDPFNLACSFHEIDPPFEFVLRVAGFDKVSHSNFLDNKEFKGKKLKIEKERDNPNDERAIKVMLEGKKAGYIPKGHTDSFHNWMNKRQLGEVRVFKMNGVKNSPYLYAFVSVVE